MQIKILSGFAFAHRGVDIRHYTAGTVVDADDPELIGVALEQGWAAAASAGPAEPMRAPEDKDAARLRTARKRKEGTP
jgi:hypothetical protein